MAISPLAHESKTARAFVTDEDPPRACATRQGLLEQCAGNDAVLYPAHFPDPAAGRVRRAERYFAYDFIR